MSQGNKNPNKGNAANITAAERTSPRIKPPAVKSELSPPRPENTPNVKPGPSVKTKKLYIPNLNVGRKMRPTSAVETVENAPSVAAQVQCKIEPNETMPEHCQSPVNKSTKAKRKQLVQTEGTFYSGKQPHALIENRLAKIPGDKSKFEDNTLKIKEEHSEEEEDDDDTALGDVPKSLPQKLSGQSDPLSFLAKGEESLLYILKMPKYVPSPINAPLANSKCTLRDLPEGHIGSLQVLRNGEMRLRLGECVIKLHSGITPMYKEDIAVVTTDTKGESGEIINLGEVFGHIIGVPDVFDRI